MRLHRLALAALLASPAFAHADTFEFIGPTTKFVFELPDNPAPPVFATGDNFQLFNVPASGSFGDQNLEVAFYNSASTVTSGGFAFSEGGPGFSFSGAQLYTGSEADPTFLGGVFELTSLSGDNVTLIITAEHAPPPPPPAPVPEPSTLALLGTGLLGLVSAGHRRPLRRRPLRH